MRTWTTLAAAAAATTCIACGSVQQAAPAAATTLSALAPSVEPAGEPASIPPAQPFEASDLPDSPWSDAPVARDRVPAPILSAWARADNRDRCAPIAPIDLGAGSGARARVSDFDGGWAVEFDQRGMPGLARDGQPCARCGRGVFGIAGTNLTADDLLDETTDASAPTPSFADGSHVRLEPAAEGEVVAAATLTVGGDECVYQVWSFLGEPHVRELVSALRRVDVAAPVEIASR